MPIYEFKCNECDDEFEKMVPFSEADRTQSCPTCQSLNTRKKISAFASHGSTAGGAGVSSGSSCGSNGGFT
jgi:putative FmdB family regulatory protein